VDTLSFGSLQETPGALIRSYDGLGAGLGQFRLCGKAESVNWP
jgi:hypothetical protein